MRRIPLLIATLCFWATTTVAQVFPENHATSVNDYADLIPARAEAELAARLDRLKAETGTEFTVVTLSSLRFYANNMDIDTYGTALFNAWAVGDPVKNDGVLLIVFPDDRELKVALGSGYGGRAVSDSARVIDDTILPAFSAGDYSGGIRAGVEALILRVVTPLQMGTAPPVTSEGKGHGFYWFIGAIVAAFGGVFMLKRRSAAKLAATPCPACGKTGLQRQRVTLQEPTATEPGRGEVRTTCPSCGHGSAAPFTIAVKAHEKPDNFGGGKTGGQGATGKW